MALRVEDFSAGGVQYGTTPYPDSAPVAPTVQAPSTTPTPTPSGGASPYDGLFSAKTQEYNLPPGMLKALASQESGYNPDPPQHPIQNKGSSHFGQSAQGMFQFMPKTWTGEGHVGDPLNPEDATEAAAKKLSASLKKHGTVGDALKDWYGRGNAGPGQPTTQEFMSQVIRRMNGFNQVGQAPQQQAQAPQQQYRKGRWVEDDRGDLTRGISHAAGMIPMTGYGALAGIGATGEWAFGEGGASTALKKFGLEGYQEHAADAQASSKYSDSLSYSWERAKGGDLGSLVDWFQYSLGYGGMNLAQMMVTFGIGGVVGKAVTKTAVEKLLMPQITKEATKLAGKGKVTAEITKQAVSNVAKKVGQFGAVGATGFGMEGGEIGGGLAEKSEERGTPLTGEEIAKGLGATAVAGSAELFGNILGLKAIFGKIPVVSKLGKTGGLKGKAIRAAGGVAAVAPVEAATEGFQTYVEEYGIGNPITKATHTQAFDAAGLGFVAGGGAAVLGGAMSSPAPSEVPPTPEINTADSVNPVGPPERAPGLPNIQQVSPEGLAGSGQQIDELMVDSDPGMTTEQQQDRVAQRAAILGLSRQDYVSKTVEKMITSLFAPTKRAAMTRDYMAALEGDTNARDRIVDAIQSQQNPDKEQHAIAAIAALDTLPQTLKAEKAQLYNDQPSAAPEVGETADLFDGQARVPVPGFWDLVNSEQNAQYTDDEYALRMRELENRYFAATDATEAAAIKDIALDELADIFWGGNIDQVKAVQQEVSDAYHKEYNQFRKDQDKIRRDYELTKNKSKQARLRRKIMQNNDAWNRRDAHLKARFDRVAAQAKPRSAAQKKAKPVKPYKPSEFENTVATEDWQKKTESSIKKSVSRTGKSNATVEMVKGWIKALLGDGIINVRVVQTVSDLPAHMLERLSEDDKQVMRGAWDKKTDEVFLIADRLHSRTDSIFVMLHEAAHRGLVALFGSDVATVMEQIHKENPRIQAMAKQYIDNEGMTVAQATEEVIADMADANMTRSIRGWQGLVRAIQRWLERAFGPIWKGEPFSDRDVQVLAAVAARHGMNSDVKDLETAMRIHELKAMDNPFDGPVERAQQSIRDRLAAIDLDDVEVERRISIITDRAKKRIAHAEINAVRTRMGASIVGDATDEIKLSRPMTYDTFREILTDKKGTAREYGKKVPDFVLKHLATLGQLIDVVKDVLPAAARFDKFVRQMHAESNEADNRAAVIATKWGDLDERASTAELDKLNTFITDAEQWGLRPDVARGFDDLANTWGIAQFENRIQAKAKYEELKVQWNQLTPQAREVYTLQAEMSTDMIRKVVQNLQDNIRDMIPDAETRDAMIKGLEERWKAAKAGRPWISHKRHGEYVVIVEANGQREVYGYETEVQAEEYKKIHEQRYAAHNPKVQIFKGADVFANLDGADRTIINKIQQSITQSITDPEEAQLLSSAVQEIYVAALPEMSGAKRLMTRKDVPGWDTNYRRSWSEGMMSMARYAAKLKHLNSIRDAIEDAGRQAGKDKTVYAITYWTTKDNKPVLSTRFFNNALDKSAFVASLGKDQSHDKASARPDAIMPLVKNTYVRELGKNDGDLAFADTEREFRQNKTDTKVAPPYENAVKSSRYYNVLRHRYSSMLVHKPRGPISNFLINLGFVNYLGWTPAFAFMNITQVTMLTLPRLAARYGFSEARDAIAKGYAFAGANHEVFTKLAGAAWTKGGIDALQISDFKNTDGSKLSPEHESVLQYLLNHGKLDFTQGSELNAITDESNVFVQRIVKSSSTLAHPTEVLNRVVTAIATYELAYGKTSNALSPEMKQQSALETAIEVLDATQYDYAPENRPLALNNPVLRVALQFRQFSQQTAWQMGKAVKQALNKLPTEQRREQRAYLVYMLATTLTFAGVRGLPAAGSVMLILSLLGDDDDDDLEFDIQKNLRDTLGDTLGPAVAGGVFNLMGIDAAANIGYGDIFPGSNSSNRATTNGKDRLRNYLFDAAGPTAAFAGNVMNGMDTMEKGDFWRGIEEGLPKAARTPMKAYRLSNRGMETKSGVVRLKGTDITPWDIAITAMGLKPTKLGWIQEQVNAVQSQEAALRMQSQILRKRLHFAIQFHDGEEESLVRDKISKFSKDNPAFRISGRAMSGASLARQQRKADATGGIAMTKGQVDLYNIIMNDGEDEDY